MPVALMAGIRGQTCLIAWSGVRDCAPPDRAFAYGSTAHYMISHRTDRAMRNCQLTGRSSSP
jgi:hypothetical protein